MNTKTLTRNQSLVYDALSRSQAPLSAYVILDKLRDSGFRAPLQVYRALEKLIEFGLVHRLESLNAFVACPHPATRHHPAFMVCRLCRAVAEAEAAGAEGALGPSASEIGFRIERTVIEAEGLCPACSAAGSPCR